MATNTPAPVSNKIVNVPNQITAARFVLAIGLFVAMPLGYFGVGLVLFLVAAATDWMDGYWARKYDQVTQLGRIFDPFVDKILICGAFIYLAAEPGSGIGAWMAVVVVGRELLVTVIRSYIEQHGGDFSASKSGKLKMVFQCIAVVASLWALKQGGVQQCPQWLGYAVLGTVWVAVASTIQSGVGYIFAAGKLISA